MKPQTFVLQARLCDRATALKTRMAQAHDKAKQLVERAEGCLAVLDHVRQGTSTAADISLADDAGPLIEALHRAESDWHNQLQMLKALLTELMHQSQSNRGEIESLAALAFRLQATPEAFAAAERAAEAHQSHFEELDAQLETARTWFERFDMQINAIVAHLRKSP
ncbi:hypothetical protein [Paraburkholderia phytofirmans]|uniref:Uncharacterized protein n=1 Tax=Paraburkholderia phytofirmans (strain DSM 17436 / LMG 22146 / PsJN) TaxID=398527 RepID=B2TAX1_PARPJ|nr:hypothetical protein [Paraburkholderia phytofirmans]ACD20567.1 hypothetical protein Bphyt_6240 [Paraburkholderia phytofirmans PsJN]